ncbi:MAG: DNA primase, partial [Candidatus Marinimicrobia bacterium]|nr:DNA primase [Candidatus Neomarinimicrobiota bacterium]
TGKVWRRDMMRIVKRCGQQTAQAIFREALTLDNEKREKSFKWAMLSESAPRLNAMIGEAEPMLAIDIADFDCDPSLVNFKNGTMEKNGTLRKHRREDYLMAIANVDYDPHRTCLNWLGFLDHAMGGNEDLVAFLQRAVGYSLTGHIDERCMFVPYGSGRNGKTTFVETIAKMMGDYAGGLRSETLMLKRWDTIPSDIAALKGKRFVTVAEAGEHARLDESLVKQITGGDTIKARFMYAELFEFQPECKLWLSTNHKPAIRGPDPAIWDRIRLVPFSVRIADPKPRREVDAMFKAEMAGIMAWAVQGMLQWYEGGLAEPDGVIAATAQYQSESDAVGAFIAECCELGIDFKESSGDLFAAYRYWAEREGERSISHQMFGRKLAERDVLTLNREGGKRRYWTGIRLLNEAIPPDGWKGYI